jgi:hypothetical protein
MYGTAVKGTDIASREQNLSGTVDVWLERRNPSSFELRAAGAKAGWTP